MPRQKQLIDNMVSHALNPFDVVFYRGHFAPTSRSMHTSFTEKMQDTFEVISGETSLWSWMTYYDPYIYADVDHDERLAPMYGVRLALRTRSGLFDYATLGVFRGLHLLCSLLDELYKSSVSKSSTISKILLYYVLAAIVYPLHLVGNGVLRPIISGVVMLALTPIVFLSHGISQVIQLLKGVSLSLTKVPTPPVPTPTVAEHSTSKIRNILHDQLKDEGIYLAYSPVVAATQQQDGKMNVTFFTTKNTECTIEFSDTLWEKVATINKSARNQYLINQYGTEDNDNKEAESQMQQRLYSPRQLGA